MNTRDMRSGKHGYDRFEELGISLCLVSNGMIVEQFEI
jgi:hypothetical protein